jgi:hypothetical protein
MLGSSGSIKKWRKHQRVGENIEFLLLKVFKIHLQKNNKKIKNTKKNDTNAKHPQMFTYKMTVVLAGEAKSGGRTKK